MRRIALIRHAATDGHASAADQIAKGLPLRQRAAGTRGALLLHEARDVLASLHSSSSNASRCVLSSRCKPAKAAVLLFDQTRQDLRAELSQRALHVAATQAARSSRTLQNRVLALLGQRRKLWTLLNRLQGRTLGIRTSRACQRHLLPECRRATSDKRRKKFAHRVELAALFFNACLRRCGLCGGASARCAGLHTGAQKRAAKQGKTCANGHDGFPS